MWFLFAALGPALWSVNNYTDKHLIARYFKGGGEGALAIFSALAGRLALPIVVIVQPAVLRVEVGLALLGLLAGIVYVGAVLPYLYAMRRGEGALVMPMLQLVTVFAYVWGLIVLGEQLTLVQGLAAGVVVGAAALLSFELADGRLSGSGPLHLVPFGRCLRRETLLRCCRRCGDTNLQRRIR